MFGITFSYKKIIFKCKEYRIDAEGEIQADDKISVPVQIVNSQTVLTSEDPKGTAIAPFRIAKRLGRTSLKGPTYLLNRSASI